jgi:hypothetical protein
MLPWTIADMGRGQYSKDKIKRVIKLIIMFKPSQKSGKSNQIRSIET